MEKTRRCEAAPTLQAEPRVSYDQPGYRFPDPVEACIQTDLDQIHVSRPYGQIATEGARVSERRILLPERLHVDLRGQGERKSANEGDEQQQAIAAQRCEMGFRSHGAFGRWLE